MKALITGFAGQDGYYLTKELQAHGYEVAGLYRGQDEKRLKRLTDDLPDVHIVRGDLLDAASIHTAVSETKPDVVFNLAAPSFVGLSWSAPGLYVDAITKGTVNVLEAVRTHAPDAHVVQASTSEMYGNSLSGPAHEQMPMIPASPYGVAKLAAHRMCNVYRDSYGMRVSCAISFNHESPRRPEIFVTRKITAAAARGERVQLGDINSVRDWGHARDFVRAFRMMAERRYGDDFVIGTGVTHTVADVCRLAYGEDWAQMVDADMVKRPNDLTFLCANPQKAKVVLGWRPQTTFEQLIEEMVMEDAGVFA